ncbi:MAG: LVIVD repeat-containing protein [Gemmatimonadaceae bacterium]
MPPPASGPAALAVAGQGEVLNRFTAEVWVRGSVAYTTTWGARAGAMGNAIYVWDVAGDTPQLRDSVIVDSASTLGDVQATDDGRYLVVATEFAPGSIVIFDLADPLKPQKLSRFTSGSITRGVHTAEVRRVNGRNHAFLAVNQGTSHASRLVIVDFDDAANPREVLARDIGRPFIHDTFVRDGILFTAEWHDGVSLWDIGGGGRSGTPQNPVALGNARTANGSVHNVFWFHDPISQSKRYAFIGEEGPALVGSRSSGDVHVVDVSDVTRPIEVAAYHVDGAGTHNFSMDEPNGILYAAFYNGGVRAIDVRGDLSACAANQKFADGRCDLEKMGRVRAIGLLDRGKPVYVWGVHFSGSHVYASDMLNGLWKLRPVSR